MRVFYTCDAGGSPVIVRWFIDGLTLQLNLDDRRGDVSLHDITSVGVTAKAHAQHPNTWREL